MDRKRNNLLKIAAAGLVCLGIACVFTRMPGFARAGYSSLFEMINIPVFMAVTGILICEILFIKGQNNKEKSRRICMIAAFIVALLMLFHGHDDLYAKLMPGQDLTLISMTVREQNDTSEEDGVLHVWNSGVGKMSFLQNYFGNRELILDSSVDESELDRYITMCAVPASQMRRDEGIPVSDELVGKIMAYPFWNNKSNDYVVDEYWKDAEAIRVIKGEEGYIFCSQALIEAFLADPLFTSEQYNTSLAMDYDQKSTLAISTVRETAEGIPGRNIRQIIIMVAFLVLGLLITLPLFGGKYPVLAFFTGFPMGAAFWCICTMLLMLLNIPYNLLTICVSIVLLMGIWMYIKREAYKKVDWSLVLTFVLAALCLITLLVYARICSVSMDSYAKTIMGYRLAKFGSLREVFGGAAPFGMVEPIVTSVGFLLGCDYVYAFYPLIGISGIGIMCAGLHYLYRRNGKSGESIQAFGMGMILLLSNYDFLLSIFYGMAQGPTSVYTLIMVVFITLKKELDLPDCSGIVIMAATMVTLIRVEGAAYALFILAASLGVEDGRLMVKKMIISEAAVIVVWNVYQWIFVGRSGGEIFWTPEKGIILICGSIMAALIAVVFDKRWAIINFVRKYYYILVMAALIGGAAVTSVVSKRAMASVNFPMYLAHFTNSAEDDTNAAAFWVFLLLMCPVLLSLRNRTAEYAAAVVAGYLVLIYFICLFRGDVPLRLGYSDSGRRTIVHVMSVAVWLLAYVLADRNSCERREDAYGYGLQRKVSK